MMTADDILDWARQRPDRATAERLVRNELCLGAIRHVVDTWLADDDEDASSPAAVLIAVDNLLIEAGR